MLIAALILFRYVYYFIESFRKMLYNYSWTLVKLRANANVSFGKETLQHFAKLVELTRYPTQELAERLFNRSWNGTICGCWSIWHWRCRNSWLQRCKVEIKWIIKLNF